MNQNNKKKQKKKKTLKVPITAIVVIVIGIIFSTVAFAQTTYNLTASGTMNLGIHDGVVITDVTMENHTSNSSASISHYVKSILTNDVILNDSESYVTLKVTLKNTDNVKYKFKGILYDTTQNNALGAYSNADIIPEVTTGTNGITTDTIVDENATIIVYVKYKYTGAQFTDGHLTGTIKLNFSRLYNINFELDGGTINVGQQTYFETGETVSLLQPSKNNSDFIGWYSDSSYTNGINSITGQTSNITVYAKFLTYYDIYFQMPPDWYKPEQQNDYDVYMYLFNTSDSTIKNAEWPGVQITHYTTAGQDYIYKYNAREDVLNQYNRVIFSNGQTAGGIYNTVESEKKYKQTIDISLSNSNYGKIFVPELYSTNGDEKRIFARSGFNFHYYIWNNSTGAKPIGGDWPGTPFSKTINNSTSFFYAIINKSQFDKIIMNRGSNTDQTQTFDVPNVQDLTLSYSWDYHYYYFVRVFYSGSWHNFNNWISTDYSTWRNSDYTTFANTETDINSLNYYLN